MKKLIKILAAIACTFLVGCGSADANIDVSAVYTQVATMVKGDMVEMNDNYISNYYGISVEDLSGYVFAQSDDPKSAETVIMFKCEDKEKRKAYTENVENALEQKYSELSNYDQPEEAKLVEKAKIKQSGNFVYLVISENADDINKLIKNSIS